MQDIAFSNLVKQDKGSWSSVHIGTLETTEVGTEEVLIESTDSATGGVNILSKLASSSDMEAFWADMKDSVLAAKMCSKVSDQKTLLDATDSLTAECGRPQMTLLQPYAGHVWEACHYSIIEMQ